jgi:spermidine synthase
VVFDRVNPESHVDVSRPADSPGSGIFLLPSFFSATLLASATLLFLVQPLAARMVVPMLGGTPAVWNTCMLFFQALLLGGYAYAHFTSRSLPLKGQIALHLGLFGLILFALPIAISPAPIARVSPEQAPSLWLLASLGAGVGLPFFMLSTSAPLLQHWFSKTAHPLARDPYFLYAPSNVGSLAALLGYPALVEPFLRLEQQNRLWSAGYGLLALLLLGCALLTLRTRIQARSPAEAAEAHGPPTPDGSSGPQKVQSGDRLLWIGLSFIPSSLMLGTTTYLAADIASIPLLWVLPLALYLLTFILAFSRRRRLPDAWVLRAVPIGAVALFYLLLSEATQPAWLILALHLVYFFIAALAAHSRLAQRRPRVESLTDFYFCISLGGVLGGLFNALVAPHLFTRVLEYPITILVACLVGPAAGAGAVPGSGRLRSMDLILPLGVGAVAAALILFWPPRSEDPQPFRVAILFGVPLLLSYLLVDRTVRFALALGTVLLASSVYAGGYGRTLHAERNFFGVARVTLDPQKRFHQLIHGNTIHGRQFIDPARQFEPLSYYHRTGPLGEVFRAFNARSSASRIAVVGLGTGSALAYAEPDQVWTLYEINPAVVRIAQNTNFFTYLHNSRAGRIEFFLGDARLRLREAVPGQFDLMILDAFSSDSIPVHLITKEAFELYLAKLAPGGLLTFHISNRSLDLEPVVGDLARDLGLAAMAQEDEPRPAEIEEGKSHSHWVVLARSEEDFGRLTRNSRWLPLEARGDARVWTDDFSNILSVFRWR